MFSSFGALVASRVVIINSRYGSITFALAGQLLPVLSAYAMAHRRIYYSCIDGFKQVPNSWRFVHSAQLYKNVAHFKSIH